MATYSTYKDSGQQWLGLIPSHWEYRRLWTLFNNRIKSNTDFTYQTAHKFNYGTLVLKNETVDSEDLRETYVKYSVIRKNDIVLNGLNLNYDLKSMRVAIAPQNGIITSAYIILRPEDGVNAKFYNYYFKAMDSRKIFHGMGTGIRLTLSFTELRNIDLAFPPAEEQKAIVEYLDKVTAVIDKAIEAKERIIAALEERRKIIITQAVTRGINPDVPLRDSGIDWLGKIPEHWKNVKLGTLGTTINGVSNDSSYFGSGFPFVSYSDVYKNPELPSDVKGLAKSSQAEQKIYSVQAGDVFFTRTSETAEEIGFSSVCTKSIPNAVFAGFLIRFRPKDKRLNPNFAKYYFRASIHRSYFVKEMNLVIRASLSQKLLRGLPVLIPPFEEQTQIADYLNHVIGKIEKILDNERLEVDLLRERKNIIINETVTGKVKVI